MIARPLRPGPSRWATSGSASDVPVAVRKGSQDAYERLRAAIVGGRLQPNERLVEADLIPMLHASRSAVRTALVRLVQEGLVEHEPNRGAKVRLVDEHEAAEILESRMVLEGLAARYAAQNATEEQVAELREILKEMRSLLDAGDLVGASELNARLHALLLEIAGHRTVSRLVAMLSSQLVRFQYRTILAPGRAEQSHAEHRAIVDAVARGDADAAEQAVRDHLAHVVDGAALAATDARLGATASMHERQLTRRGVAIIGIGEAGAEIARDLVAAGCSVRASDPNPAREVPGAELAGSTADAVRGADLVLSLTTAEAARAAATAAAPALQPGAVYADLNTGSAQLKRDVAATVEDAGALFADVAVMAPVPGRGLRTPLLASGSGAERLAELLRPLGAHVEVLGPRAGNGRRAKAAPLGLHEGPRRGPARRRRRRRGRPGARTGSGRTPQRRSPRPTSISSTGCWRAAACMPRAACTSSTDAAELLRELGVQPRVTDAARAVLAELAG